MMSSSDDTSDCECSEFGVNESYYTEKFKPAVSTSKKYRLVESVVHNDVNTLRELLNKPSIWYQVTDKYGNNLLQLAVLRNKKEVFDYILSLDEFPLDQGNKQGLTALTMALLCPTMRGYFAVELIKKGAYLYKLALHDAVLSSCVEVILLLLEKGVDPNKKSPDGATALHVALEKEHLFARGYYNYEIEFALLCYGADPLIEDDCGYSSFEEALETHPDKSEYLKFLDFLFMYTIDKFTELKVNMHVLLQLARQRSVFLTDVVEHLTEVTVDSEGARNYNHLVSTDKKCMNMLVEKCGFLIIYVLIANKYIAYLVPFNVNANISIENLSCFVENTLQQNFVDFVSGLQSNKVFGALMHLDLHESTLIELICYLLSYGLRLNELDLQMVYKKYGYCKLFKILLHMDFDFVAHDDVKLESVTCVEKSIVPILVYDIHFDLQVYLESLDIFPKINCDKVEEYTTRHVDLLLDYFADRNLKEVCNIFSTNEDLLHMRLAYYKNSEPVVAAKIERLPQIPLLLQLARDTFRRFFIDKYHIKTTAQFFTYINCLAISDAYKKIITFEKTIY